MGSIALWAMDRGVPFYIEDMAQQKVDNLPRFTGSPLYDYQVYGEPFSVSFDP